MDITSESIFRLFLKIGIPVMVGMFFNTMYNIVDTYFAGMLGDESLAGVTITFPVFLFLFSMAIAVSSASSALIGNALGQKMSDLADKYLSNAISLGIIISVVLGTLMYFSLDIILSYFSLHPAAQSEGVSYMGVFIATGGGVFLVLSSILNSALNARGKTKVYRNILIFGFFLNILLDPLLAFGYEVGGMQIIPAMGVAGISFSTVILQYLSVFILVIVLRKEKLLNNVSWKYFIPEKQIIWELTKQGIPTFVMMMSVSASMFIHNKFVSIYGQTAIAGYGGGIRVEQLVLVLLMSISTTTMIIVGQNNGAKKYERIKETYYMALKIAFCCFLLMYGVVYYFASSVMGLFTKDIETIKVGVGYIQSQFFTFFAYVLISISGAVLQGIKKPGIIIYNEIYRHIVASFIFIYPLVHFTDMSINAVWLGITIKTWTAAIFILIWTHWQYNRLIKTSL